MMKKRVKLLTVLLSCVGTILSGCSMVDEPCAYCGSSPSKTYELSTGSEIYVCTDCSSKCAFCSDKATKHYESLLGIVFVCGDCYEEVMELNNY